jgi:hypothetical protein
MFIVIAGLIFIVITNFGSYKNYQQKEERTHLNFLKTEACVNEWMCHF